MSHFNDNFKLIFKTWQAFLNEGPVSNEDAGKGFVDLFVKSPESAQHALDLINTGLKYYGALKTTEVNSDEYDSVMDALTLPGQPQDKNISDEDIDETIEHFENIKKSLENYLSSQS
tara:strand:+ start:443 stop:793 length:351 start_codon:yes stop_codon:yes gene_type:complete